VPDIEDDRDQRECRFRSLYEEHYRSIQAYAVRRVGSPDDVADVVAEVFTIAWRRLARIPEPPADRLWLYGVARRVVAGKLRSARRRRQLTARLQASHAANRNPGGHDQESARDRLAAALTADSGKAAGHLPGPGQFLYVQDIEQKGLGTSTQAGCRGKSITQAWMARDASGREVITYPDGGCKPVRVTFPKGRFPWWFGNYAASGLPARPADLERAIVRHLEGGHARTRVAPDPHSQVLHSAVLHSAVLHSPVLHSPVPHGTVPHGTDPRSADRRALDAH
jgi:hypothetical protein